MVRPPMPKVKEPKTLLIFTGIFLAVGLGLILIEAVSLLTVKGVGVKGNMIPAG